MIRAAFFDIDGTLLSFRTHRVSAGTVKAFDLLHRHGVRTFISSGRPEVLIPRMPLHFDGYCTMNGGYVFVGDEVLVSHPIPVEESDRWLRHCRENRLSTMLFTEHEMYACNIGKEAILLRDKLEFEMPPIVPVESLMGHEAFQLIAVVPPEADASLEQMLPHCRMPRWCDSFTDVIHRDNSKAVGLDRICRHFGIRQEETVAFGDGANDIEMLEWSGIGVAMGNAAEEVKQHADLVTTSVDEEGILRAVEKIICDQ